MILVPIIVFVVYALFNAKRTVKEAAIKEVTTASADATTRLLVMCVVGVILLAIATGNIS